jgi:hypothetical protein
LPNCGTQPLLSTHAHNTSTLHGSRYYCYRIPFILRTSPHLAVRNPNPNPIFHDDHHADSRNTSLLSSIDSIYIVIARGSFVSITTADIPLPKQMLSPTFKTVRRIVLALSKTQTSKLYSSNPVDEQHRRKASHTHHSEATSRTFEKYWTHILFLSADVRWWNNSCLTRGTFQASLDMALPILHSYP